MLRVPLDDLEPGERDLPREAARYVARVHRLRPGDRFVAFDPAARLEAEAELLSVRPETVRVTLDEPVAATRVAERPITVIQGLAKGAKLDSVVRDATELGATRVVAAIASRSVKRPARGTRWRRIALEAARQCGRGDAVEVQGPLPLEEALAPHAEEGVGLLLHPEGGAGLRQQLASVGASTPLVVVIGPEGGFDERELSLAEASGYRRVTLGRFVMRSETACAAVLGAIAALSQGI